jgi:molybdopterin-guanine dinucleotide biosynthesis protein A
MVGGRRIVDRVAAALAKVCDQLVLAANDSDSGSWLAGVPIVRDHYVDAGGLSGIDAALRWAAERPPLDGALVVAWDMPFVSAPLLGALLESATTSGADVAVPESVSPYGFEPFCAYYGAPAATQLREYLQGGGGAAGDFISKVNAEHVPLEVLRRFGDPAVMLGSVNTSEDLAVADARARRGL